MKGQGLGILRPALQSAGSAADQHIKAVLKLLHKLYRLILPLSISHDKWEVYEFMMHDNNAFSFVSVDPGPIGCQLNVSCLQQGGSLLSSIGVEQGSWHSDVGDDPLMFTLLIILLRLPHGVSIYFTALDLKHN